MRDTYPAQNINILNSKYHCKQFPFSRRRTNNFPFQTVREEGSQLYWTAHKPNWSPTSSLFQKEYILFTFGLHLAHNTTLRQFPNSKL